MVMNNSDAAIYEKIMADLPGNVKVIEQVPIHEIETLFRHAACYLSTSRYEGFPNAFLQAAKYSVPVVSLSVDPNKMLTEHGGGVFACDDFPAMVQSIHHLWTDETARIALGAKAEAYVRQFHDLDRSLDVLTKIICDLASSSAMDRSGG
jgi:glycosyltransferase involved in cell wall biosynthesis